MKIPFNKPFISGKETDYIKQAVSSGHISGNGVFTKQCHSFFEKKFGIKKSLLTSSCTDALEMSAILLDIQPGDEVIMPSYTFVSTANAFILRGAKIIFADSNEENPNMDVHQIEPLITAKTKAFVPVHYAGVACDMDILSKLSVQYKISIVEDAAQSIDSYYKGKVLGSIGDLATFSFHETKNVISGEGGLLAINNRDYFERSEIIWEKGTNRAAFFRGEVNKYGWVDMGSSFLPSEITAAFLFAQLENLERIQNKRKELWQRYFSNLLNLNNEGYLQLPNIPQYATNNGHLFYILLDSLERRSNLIKFLSQRGIHAVFHYLPLHKSPFYHDNHDGRELHNADQYSERLLRLPLFFSLTENDVDYITESIYAFFAK